ncbi:MAG: RsmB/NOP family class I SAM-dependent RNA methyltransferase [Bacilli bacterium]|nr:RsmB/NOP family class I SAM-dependent RNA methyltransferase [Bacilli bacterium]
MDFKEHITNLLGKEKYDKLVFSLEDKPFSAIHINTNKFSIDSEAYKIFTSKMKKHPFVKNAYYINEKMGNHPYHIAGGFYIQEPSAMLVGEIIPIEKDDLVVDICAAPGGKSSHIANKLSENGLLISNEINYPRAKILSENIERQGIKNCIITNEDIDTLINTYSGIFDKVILDAPCSGEGMFRKNDLVKNDWSYDKVLKCATIQKDLILKSYKLLKHNGIMIYSTCTFSKEENEDIVNYLLGKTNASLINIEPFKNLSRGIDMPEALRIFPFDFEGEGHFVALIKCNDYNEEIKKNYASKKINQQVLKLLDSFCQDNLTYKFDPKRIYIKNDDIYYLPPKIIGFENLRHLRVGQHIGKILKNRIEPSHGFAMSSKKEDFQRFINLTLHDELMLSKFIHGETLNVDLENGYCLILIDGMSIGYGKVVNNILKNLFPKGLRK